jgi:murein DD-endopeptidase MepM/ murein hydrolase activator NlpD
MRFSMPVPENSPVTQTFQEHEQRRKENGWVYYNGGIDWGVPEGTPIKAAADGRVIAAQASTSGYGEHIRIQHAETYVTVYGHLSAYACNPGQNVKEGEVIGYSGNTGNSTGPHLHWEVRKGGIPVDGMPLLRTIEDPIPEFPGTIPTAVSVTATGVRLRNAPYGSIQALAEAGSNWHVMCAEKDESGKVWYRVNAELYIASWYTEPAV